MSEPQIEIEGYRFELTCPACPEQYDVFRGPVQVGYVRCRWGVMRVDCPDACDETVLEVTLEDDYQGVLVEAEANLGPYDYQHPRRIELLTKAQQAIAQWVQRNIAKENKE